MNLKPVFTTSTGSKIEPLECFTDVSQVQKLNAIYIYAIGTAFYVRF